MAQRIDKAITLVEEALTASDSANVVLDDAENAEIERSEAENLLFELKRYTADIQIDKELFKAIPIKLGIISRYWRELLILIRDAYLEDLKR